MSSPHQLYIAHFSNVYRPVTSGVAISVDSFKAAQRELGHQVCVLAPSAGDYVDDERFVVRYPALELPMQKYPLAAPISATAEDFLELFKPDVLHSHHPALLGRVAAQLSEENNLPLVFTYHTRYHDYSHYAAPFPTERVGELITHWLGHYMSSCHLVVVPSESIKEIVSQRYGLEEGIKVVPTGVDLDRFGALNKLNSRRQRAWPEEEFVMVSVGRLAKEKNFDLLLEAVSRLEKKRPWRLVLVGDGDEREGLEQLAQELGIADRVEFPGRVDYAQMPEYLTAADLFCFASVTETQGLVTLEGMASGLPVAAVRASGTSDAVESGQQGLLTEANPEALAEAIRRLMIEDEFRQACAGRARERAREFSPQQQAQRMIEVYHQAMELCRAGTRLHPALNSHWEAFLDFTGLSSLAS